MTTQHPDRELPDTNVCWEGELAPPRFEPLMGYPVQAVSPETIYIGKIKMDSAGCIYVFVYMFVTVMNKKRLSS